LARLPSAASSPRRRRSRRPARAPEPGSVRTRRAGSVAAHPHRQSSSCGCSGPCSRRRGGRRAGAHRPIASGCSRCSPASWSRRWRDRSAAPGSSLRRTARRCRWHGSRRRPAPDRPASRSGCRPAHPGPRARRRHGRPSHPRRPPGCRSSAGHPATGGRPAVCRVAACRRRRRTARRATMPAFGSRRPAATVRSSSTSRARGRRAPRRGPRRYVRARSRAPRLAGACR
jgi:hypothetical protein